MKKMLCLVLCMLLPLAALAEESTAPLLTVNELTAWAEGYIARARVEKPLNDPSQHLTPDGYEYVYTFATLYGDTPNVSPDTIFSTVVLTADDENGPRNVNVGNAMAVVIDAYYSENPHLLGTREAAALYAVDTLPESAQWGQVLRDGQRVQTIQYGVHEQYATGGEGYTDMGVIYTMADNRVSAIRVYGLNSRIDLDTVNSALYSVMVNALEKDYAQVPFSYDGAALERFSSQDLIFSGIDLLGLTPDKAIALFGEPMSDNWVDNGEEGYIRVQLFDGCEAIFLFNEARTEGRLYMFVITGDELEGPRAVRVGDSFASVYNRFRNGEGEYQDNDVEILYGAEAEGDFGAAYYGENASATLRYGVVLEDGRRIILQTEYDVMDCTEIMLTVE